MSSLSSISLDWFRKQPKKCPTWEFEGAEYTRGKYGKLKIGDNVIVHPYPTSEMSEPYGVIVKEYEGHLCTYYPGKWHTYINENLFNRLELKDDARETLRIHK